jgi:organic hydroperoxide reductase OsmC/OhrA
MIRTTSDEAAAMDHEHHYEITTTWTGNRGAGTKDYRAYTRDHEISAERKSAPVAGSSDKTFRGDAARYNPEELLVAALSACHMLWFLHLCAEAGIVVTDYRDSAMGTMTEHTDGSGEFTRVTLRPHAVIASPDRMAEATELHAKAHHMCFIARSVNFPVEHEPVVKTL